VTVELEVDPAEKPDRRLVVDDEDPSGRRMPPGIAHRYECNEQPVGPYPLSASARLCL
jgi:hypothetical protein